jgi:DNA repair/transcription protein MET18/MMS19
MPLLLRGLDLPDTEIRANVIDTLLATTGDDPTKPSLISEYASTLVTVMLKNVVAEGMPSIVSNVPRYIFLYNVQSMFCI